jgi:hypothetical protein
MPKNTIDIESFVTEWVAEHVRRVPGLASVPVEMDRLAAELTQAARAHSISGRELHRAVGDIDDYLAEQYSRICAAP